MTKRVSARQLTRVIKEVAGAAGAGELLEQIREHFAAIAELAGQLERAPDINEFLEDYSMAGNLEDEEEMLSPIASEMVGMCETVWGAMDRSLKFDVEEFGN